MMITCRTRLEKLGQKFLKSEDGFTLLELFLAISLSVALLSGLITLSEQWADTRLAELAGDHLEQVATAVEDYIYTVPLSTLPAGTFQDITADITQYLPLGTTMRSPLKFNYEVYILRSINPGGEDTYEAVVVGNRALAYRYLMKTARASGIKGGVIADIAPVYTPDVGKSVFGSWSEVDLTRFGLAGRLANVGADVGEGVLIAYVGVSSNEQEGPYLYREEITGRPDLNIMQTDLIMNDNSIRGVSTMDAVDMTVHNSALVGGNLTVDGDSTFTGGPVQINNGADVEGGVTVQSGDLVLAGEGDVTVDGDIQAQRVNTEALNVSSLSAQDVRIQNDFELNGTSAILAGDVEVSNPAEITINGVVNADNISANTVDAETVAVGNDIFVEGDVTVDGSIDATGTLDVGTVTTECTQLPGESYGNCP